MTDRIYTSFDNLEAHDGHILFEDKIGKVNIDKKGGSVDIYLSDYNDPNYCFYWDVACDPKDVARITMETLEEWSGNYVNETSVVLHIPDDMTAFICICSPTKREITTYTIRNGEVNADPWTIEDPGDMGYKYHRFVGELRRAMSYVDAQVRQL